MTKGKDALKLAEDNKRQIDQINKRLTTMEKSFAALEKAMAGIDKKTIDQLKTDVAALKKSNEATTKKITDGDTAVRKEMTDFIRRVETNLVKGINSTNDFASRIQDQLSSYSKEMHEYEKKQTKALRDEIANLQKWVEKNFD